MRSAHPGEDSAHKSERSAPSGEDSAHRSERSAHSSEDPAPISERSAPPSEDLAHKSKKPARTYVKPDPFHSMVGAARKFIHVGHAVAIVSYISNQAEANDMVSLAVSSIEGQLRGT